MRPITLKATPVSRNQVESVTPTNKKGRPEPKPKNNIVSAEGVANARLIPRQPLKLLLSVELGVDEFIKTVWVLVGCERSVTVNTQINFVVGKSYAFSLQPFFLFLISTGIFW